jgi:hypothetical protein
MDNHKVGLGKKTVAFLLSLLAAIALIFSFFTFPIELVLLNPQSYRLVILEEKYSEHYPEIITNVLVSQLYDLRIAGNLPDLLSNQDAFQSVLVSQLPMDWVDETMSNLVLQTIDYLNFRLPSNSLSVELNTLKSEMFLKSNDIAQGYINSLPNCSQHNKIAPGPATTIFDLPPCKPERPLESKYFEITSKYLEDIFNQLPSNFSITRLSALNEKAGDRFFYGYSISSWILRLIPLITLLLLIGIARLLVKNKTLMIRWVGRVLVFTSSICLVMLVVILIGYDQFIALIFNRTLNNLIPGFDVLLLGIIQSIGYQTLVWVVISITISMIFGISLLLISKFIKPKPTEMMTEQDHAGGQAEPDIQTQKTEPPQISEEPSMEGKSQPEEKTNSDLT